ncbi:MAG: NAD+ synthase [Simkaniaceae bacterium]|nr:NAD+ synthase [Simkaniaceae bacterium]
MKILVAQLNPLIGDLTGNTEKILKTLKDAKKQGIELVLFPELTICGYPPEDLVFHEAFIQQMMQKLEEIIPETEGMMVLVGLVRPNLYHGEKALFNSAAVIQDRQLIGFQDKWLLPNYDVFNERRYFEPGHFTRTWEWKGKRIGIVICEDIWQHAGYVDFTRYERDPIVALIPYKPDLLLNLSASPYQYQKPDVRVKVCAKAARTLGCPVILCCQVGANGQLIFDGYSVYVNKDGELCQLGKGFAEDAMKIDTKATACKAPFKYNVMEDLYRALVFGVKDYARKNGFTKACLGLSGGIDSALVACIGADALGAENLLGVRMPSEYSSKHSLEDAEVLAKKLGIPLQTIPIQDVFDHYKTLLSPSFKGKKEDVTEENLQARIRGNILMALSNKFGDLVLSTGNKSEVALGYSTLYGDMCGGLGVLGDVMKTLVYELARWVNRNEEIIPQSTIDKPPSAELRLNQKDLDSLPDYGIVDKVLEGYVEDYLTREEIAEKYQIPIEKVHQLVHKIHLAEYKRRQGPPILRVSKKVFGLGRHYPIVQGWAKRL